MNVDILWSKFLTEVKDNLTSLSFESIYISNLKYLSDILTKFLTDVNSFQMGLSRF